jgi:sulfur carrier protein
MKMIINGQETDVANDVKTVVDLLAVFNLNEKLAIVELNKDILDKATYAETQLSDGDRIEIVHFVGGG